ncbi:MAG: PilN domain-containing protein [bacterium]
MAGFNGTTRLVLDFNGERIVECGLKDSAIVIVDSWNLPAGWMEKILLRGEMPGSEFAGFCGGEGVPADKDVVAVMPARLEIIRNFGLPATAENETAGMVRFEAEACLPYPQDAWQWVYEAREGAGGSGKDVVLYAVRKDAVKNCAGLLREAGMNLLRIYPWSACVAPLMCASGITGSAALVSLDEKDVVVSLTDGERVRYSRVFPRQDAGRLAVELAFTMDDCRPALKERAEKIILLGIPGVESVLNTLREEMEEEIETLDWDGSGVTGFDEAAEKKLDSLPAGAAVGASAVRLVDDGDCWDLIPRASKEELGVRKRKKMAATLAGLLIVCISAVSFWAAGKSNGYNRAIDSLEVKAKELAPRIEDINAVRAQLAVCEDAGGADYSALEIMKELSLIVPEGEVKITRLFYEKLGGIELAGQASSHAQVMSLIAKMDGLKLFRDTHLDFSRESEEFSQAVVNFEISAKFVGEEGP